MGLACTVGVSSLKVCGAGGENDNERMQLVAGPISKHPTATHTVVTASVVQFLKLGPKVRRYEKCIQILFGKT